MNPNPLVALNHFTVPVAIVVTLTLHKADNRNEAAAEYFHHTRQIPRHSLVAAQHLARESQVSIRKVAVTDFRRLPGPHPLGCLRAITLRGGDERLWLRQIQALQGISRDG